MKKLMFAATVAAAMAGFAVESQVVGYTNVKVGKFNIEVNTLKAINKTGMTLGDIATNSGYEYIEASDDEIFSGWDYEQDTINTFTAAGAFESTFCYLPQWLIELDEELAEKEAGWYLIADQGTYENCMNSKQIPFGTGYLVKAISADPSVEEPRDAALVFSGEVKNAPHDIPVGPFTLAGNSSPKNLTLGDIKTNSGYEYIEEGDQEIFSGWDYEQDTLNTYTPTGAFDSTYCYLPQWLVELDEDLAGKESGWYLISDQGSYEDCKNSTQLPMGAGFIVKAISASPSVEEPREVTVIVPSALD